MSLIVRNKQWIATDDRYVKIDEKFAYFESGTKLFRHPSNVLLLSPLGDRCSDEICEEILHLAYNKIALFFKSKEKGIPLVPFNIILLNVCNYIEDIYRKEKIDTIFYLFLRELTVEIKKTIDVDGIETVWCHEIYDQDLVKGSGEDAYIAASRLGCSVETAFKYASRMVPTVGEGIQMYPVRGIRRIDFED